MEKNLSSLNKRKVYFYSVLFLVFLFLTVNSSIAGSMFVPYHPIGPEIGDIETEYEYAIQSVEIGSSWKFDCGDGTVTDWIVLEDSDTFISRNHSWDRYGEYEVRIRYKSAYSLESSWSIPLIVTIAAPTDIDEDGWNNSAEEAYGTNPENPNDYPLDTDNDGFPDEDSIDGKYTGDIDDDADGLADSIELSLGSNPKDRSDIVSIFVENKPFFIVDTNYDSYGDILYDFQTGSTTKIKSQDGSLYLDIDNDGSWEYTYNGELFVYKPFPWLQATMGTAGIILVIVGILFKIGIIYVYEEEVIVE